MDHQVSGKMTAKIITFYPSAALTNDYCCGWVRCLRQSAVHALTLQFSYLSHSLTCCRHRLLFSSWIGRKRCLRGCLGRKSCLPRHRCSLNASGLPQLDDGWSGSIAVDCPNLMRPCDGDATKSLNVVGTSCRSFGRAALEKIPPATACYHCDYFSWSVMRMRHPHHYMNCCYYFDHQRLLMRCLCSLNCLQKCDCFECCDELSSD